MESFDQLVVCLNYQHAPTPITHKREGQIIVAGFVFIIFSRFQAMKLGVKTLALSTTQFHLTSFTSFAIT